MRGRKHGSACIDTCPVLQLTPHCIKYIFLRGGIVREAETKSQLWRTNINRREYNCVDNYTNSHGENGQNCISVRTSVF